MPITKNNGPARIETGRLIEDIACQPGHHKTVDTPNSCLCCGVVYYWPSGPLCVCVYADHWMQDELMQVSCPYHVQQKLIDGVFGALPGGFTVPSGKPVDIKPRGGRVAPIVRKYKG